jgi:hypothetical protein
MWERDLGALRTLTALAGRKLTALWSVHSNFCAPVRAAADAPPGP